MRAAGGMFLLCLGIALCVWSTHQPRLGEQQPQPWRRRALLGAAPTDAAPAGAGNPSGPANIAPRALQLSDLPDWVVAGEADMERESWRREHAKNVVRMAKVNADPSRRLDLVMWGDSLTSGLASNDDAWGEKFGDLDGLPLGVRGATVEEVAWRILIDGEMPARPPGTAVLFIGINNLLKGMEPPAGRLEWLVGQLKAAWPDTQIAITALLPNVDVEVTETNEDYAALAERQGIALLQCAQDWDPEGEQESFYTDGLHHTAEGQAALLACLRQQVEPLLQAAANQTAAAV